MGLAFLELGRLPEARAALREAAAAAPGEADQAAVRKALRRVLDAERRARASDDQTRRALGRALGGTGESSADCHYGGVGLYEDKKPRQRSAVASSGRVIDFDEDGSGDSGSGDGLTARSSAPFETCKAPPGAYVAQGRGLGFGIWRGAGSFLAVAVALAFLLR